MASYTTPDRIRKVLDPQERDDEGSAAFLENTVLEEAAARATSEVNSRLSVRYSVPFTEPWPDVITTITTDFAAYDATLSHYQSVDITDEDPVIRRYKSSRYLLLDIAAGKAELYPGESGEEPGGSTAGNIAVVNQYQGTLFSLEDFALGYERRGPGRWPSGW